MTHIRPISERRPAMAQFEAVLELVSLLSALLALIEQYADLFGISLPQKS